MREKLAEFYEADIRKLEDILDKDLDQWLK
jgi:hypothetical protein